MDKITMFGMAVKDMEASKKFYVETMGFEITTDYRQSDDRWWVNVKLPGGGVSITLSTFHENMKPGNLHLWATATDLHASYDDLKTKGAKLTSEISDDLYGPGSGVKWFSVEDPDGNGWTIGEK